MKSLESRMKDNYEHRNRYYLTRRTPVIMRLDGKAFHTFTKDFQKPFDFVLRDLMTLTAIKLLKSIQGAKCAYVQSDEISILITDFDKLSTDAWFDYNIQKMTSVSAALASAYFTQSYNSLRKKSTLVLFDSRVFNVPKEEVNNYFVSRQKDWIRNSLFMLTNSFYSSKELYKKNRAAMHEMLHAKGENWANLIDRWKNGTYIDKQEEAEEAWDLWDNCPIFSERPILINTFLEEVDA